MRLVRIAEFPVDFVGNKEKVMPAGHIPEREHAFLGIQCTRRIARIAYQDGLGPVGDGLFEFGYVRDLESFPYVGRNRLQADSVHVCECIVIGVERFEDDDFVSFVAGDFQCHVDTFAACDGHDDFRHVDVYADTFVISVDKAFPQFDESCGIAVGDISHFQVPDSLQCTVRRGNVRLAYVQMIHLHALLLGSVCQGYEFSDCRSRHFLGFERNTCHKR